MGGSLSTPNPPPPRRVSPPPRRVSPPLRWVSPPRRRVPPPPRQVSPPPRRVSPPPRRVSPHRPTSKTSSLLPAVDKVFTQTTKVGTTSASVASPVSVPLTHDICDYVVEKVDPTQSMIPNINGVPPNVRCDRHILRVCQIYQQRRNVCQKFCHRFHVCLSWINGQCKTPSCNLDHGFHSAHNTVLTSNLVDHRFSEDQLVEQLKKNVEFGRRARSKFETGPLICPHHVVGRCKHQNCRNLHLKDRYSWEVQDGNWVRLSKSMNEFLEDSFCDPEKEAISLELKGNSNSHSSDIQHLQQIFGKNCSTAQVDFRNMNLQSQSGKTYQMRRLSTPSDIFANVGANTRYLWYAKTANGRPEFITHGLTEKFYQLALSDCLERALQNGESKVICRDRSGYDVSNFTYTNHYSVYELIRRPAKLVAANAKDEKPIHFRDVWTDNMSNGVFSVSDLFVGSNEYMFVERMFRATMHGIGIQKIFRIQNTFLWDAYQLKKQQMLQTHNGDTKLLNEQYMFHGTKASVLNQIYEGNLDWRLYGSNVGCLYGRGTYFSNKASESDGYTSGSPKVILLAMVLVGEACRGDRRMDYPPKNPKTNRHYDTTVNDAVPPSIFVKYNDDEYYPAYAVYYI
ncbi:Poly(ADP-ribose) polymerase catalytic domain [Trinorchestia longiramus]|nr:Poly(ADP-ribose) polymerase catalytic domain [Trinorchestia longiramus]